MGPSRSRSTPRMIAALFLALTLAICAAAEAPAEADVQIVDISSNSATPSATDPGNDNDLPTGAEVLDRFVEVTGGAEAYAEMHNRAGEGALEFLGMGIRAHVQVFQTAPDRYYAQRDTDGLGLVEEGCDGETVWSNSMTQGPELARGAVRAYKLRSYRFNADLHWRELYERVECTGVKTLGEIPCYRVEKHPPEGQSETSWYSRSSGLLVRTDIIAPTSMGDIPIRTLYQDYRSVGKLLVPHREIVSTMGREQLMEYERIVFNTEIAPDRFALPRDIRLLIERYRARALVQAGAENDDDSAVSALDMAVNVNTNGVAAR